MRVGNRDDGDAIGNFTPKIDMKAERIEAKINIQIR